MCFVAKSACNCNYVLELISGANLTVRASKIISGQEPIKTNELLQAIGKAIDKKV